MVIGNISAIETMGLLDGPGVRVVVFLQGCSLRCLYCHNPETWNVADAKEQYTPQQLFDKIIRFKEYIKNGGVTFSGGEPLLQSEFVYECALLLKNAGIHIALDTSGIGIINKKLIDIVDLIILDIKASNADSFKKITAGKFEIFKNFLDYIQSQNKKLWLRQVIVPGINDNEKNINELAEFILPLKNIEKIELLPYTSIGVKKYTELNINYPLKNVADMNKIKCKELEEQLIKKIKNR